MKDMLCSYYTNSDEITSYMVRRLGISENDVILEPSAGEGAFIDGVLGTGQKIHIDALDISEEAVSMLKEKYKDVPDVLVRETDTLLDEQLDSYRAPLPCLKQADTLPDGQLELHRPEGGHYTKIIGNPPYGAWQDYGKRDALKKKYPGQYVKETYSLFLLRCLSVLKMHGRLSFIIPDTYLFLNMHSRLREALLTCAKIDEILIFPSKFFPGVSFGYSNLSIITLERCGLPEARENTVRIIKGFQSPAEFEYLFSDIKLPEHLRTFFLKQKDILGNDKHRFVIAEKESARLLSKKSVLLGDVADIVTGLYTGDNHRFIKALNSEVKGAKGYRIVEESQIYDCASLQGIHGVSEGYIPYIKSSSRRRYVREDDEWFVRWDEETIKEYNKDKRARFQNSSFYFKPGVGIPMVKSSAIRAFIMRDRVFDQSIVGIFPKDEKKLPYILALMNSDAVNDLIHAINPTANNSANYVKRLPYIEPDEEILDLIIQKVGKVMDAIINGEDEQMAERLHKEINAMVGKIYSDAVAAA